jgi:NAD(P)-dependent dehydrogenase (short-subunit alcohol dehydrogenase family)
MQTPPPSPLAGRTALVTGAAVRVGRAIALELARAGCRIAIHYAGSEAGALKLVRRIRQEHGEADMIQADLQDPAKIDFLLGRAREKFGPVHILVNSAAHFTSGGLLDTTLEGWEREFALNLRAPFLLTQAFARQPQLHGGSVVNILDARNRRAGADHFAYRLTKAALEAMTRNLALELAPRIRVNGVAPGAVLAPADADGNWLNQHAQKHIPLKRPGHPDAVAAAVRFLCEQEFVTGTVIPVDGGEFL